MGKFLFVVNPEAFGGQGDDRWKRFRAQWPGPMEPGDVAITAAPDHATGIAASAQGYDTLVAVGGDGTVREMVVGLMQRPSPRPRLALVPAGTGNDIARSVGLLTVEDSISALQNGHTRWIDLIQIDCHQQGRPARRYACLTTSVGFSAVVIRSLKPWMKRVLGAERAYFLATLIAVARYRPPQMVVRWGGQEYRGLTWMVNVGNAEWECGGSMRMSPGAEIDDGMLNICLIRSGPKLRVLRKLPTLFTGAHVREPEVSYFPVTEIEVESEPPAGLQMDGDVFGTTPVKFTVCPQALQVVAPRPKAPEA
jgi:YegS/Rv2252/BmrU family lipid kinase